MPQQIEEQPLLFTELTEMEILEKASEILAKRMTDQPELTSSRDTRAFLRTKLAKKEQEVFAIIFLNARHQLLSYQELFFGTIDAATVYPREVVKAALKENAAAVIFAHNHPSGHPEPSISDRQITKTLIDTLKVVDIKVLDHIVIGDGECVSFAERGLI